MIQFCSKDQKILIVDSEHSVSQVLKTRLEALGYEVCIITNGRDILHTFRKKKPNLIILDILLIGTSFKKEYKI